MDMKTGVSLLILSSLLAQSAPIHISTNEASRLRRRSSLEAPATVVKKCRPKLPILMQNSTFNSSSDTFKSLPPLNGTLASANVVNGASTALQGLGANSETGSKRCKAKNHTNYGTDSGLHTGPFLSASMGTNSSLTSTPPLIPSDGTVEAATSNSSALFSSILSETSVNGTPGARKCRPRNQGPGGLDPSMTYNGTDSQFGLDSSTNTSLGAGEGLDSIIDSGFGASMDGGLGSNGDAGLGFGSDLGSTGSIDTGFGTSMDGGLGSSGDAGLGFGSTGSIDSSFGTDMDGGLGSSGDVGLGFDVTNDSGSGFGADSGADLSAGGVDMGSGGFGGSDFDISDVGGLDLPAGGDMDVGGLDIPADGGFDISSAGDKGLPADGLLDIGGLDLPTDDGLDTFSGGNLNLGDEPIDDIGNNLLDGSVTDPVAGASDSTFSLSTDDISPLEGDPIASEQPISTGDVDEKKVLPRIEGNDDLTLDQKIGKIKDLHGQLAKVEIGSAAAAKLNEEIKSLRADISGKIAVNAEEDDEESLRAKNETNHENIEAIQQKLDTFELDEGQRKEIEEQLKDANRTAIGIEQRINDKDRNLQDLHGKKYGLEETRRRLDERIKEAGEDGGQNVEEWKESLKKVTEQIDTINDMIGDKTEKKEGGDTPGDGDGSVTSTAAIEDRDGGTPPTREDDEEAKDYAPNIEGNDDLTLEQKIGKLKDLHGQIRKKIEEGEEEDADDLQKEMESLRKSIEATQRDNNREDLDEEGLQGKAVSHENQLKRIEEQQKQDDAEEDEQPQGQDDEDDEEAADLEQDRRAIDRARITTEQRIKDKDRNLKELHSKKYGLEKTRKELDEKIKEAGPEDANEVEKWKESIERLSAQIDTVNDMINDASKN